MNLKPQQNNVPSSRKQDGGQEGDYEQMLQKLEEEARDHIRIEQQLKLHIDSLQDKIEEMEKEMRSVQEKLKLKVSACSSLEDELKVANIKCNELRQRITILEKSCLPFSTNGEISYSQASINAEEKVGKLNNDLSRMKRMGDLAKRVKIKLIE